MTVTIANVVQSTDTFGQWLAKTNQLATAMTGKAVTTDSNSAVGNASITGAYVSNAVFTNNILGGNTSTQGNLTIVTNTAFSSNVTFNSTRVNLGISSNVFITGGSATNRVLTVNTSTNAISIGKVNTTDLSDANTSGAANGSVLYYANSSTVIAASNIMLLNVTSSVVTFAANVSAANLHVSNNVVYHAGNFTPSGKLNTTGGTITGNLSVSGVLTVGGQTINSTSFTGTANNATNFNGQDASYYTNIAARLGYTPANKAGDTFTGNVSINTSNSVLTLQDSNGRSGGVRVDANTFFVLRGDGSNSTTFAQLSGEWPLEINLDTNVITVGGTINTKAILPKTNQTYDIGSSSFRYNTIYGNALTSNWADLAERYSADKAYQPGTVLQVGGVEEVTETTSYLSTTIAGVVSTQPALKMNDTAGSNETHPYVALKGRIPCFVIGPVNKGDIIVSSVIPGCGQAVNVDTTNIPSTAVVGISLVDDNRQEKRLVEIKV